MVEKIIAALKNKTPAELTTIYIHALEHLEKYGHDPKKAQDARKLMEAVENERARQKDAKEYKQSSEPPDEGMLLLSGYQVGKNHGVKTSLRRKILDRVVNGRLPFHPDLAYAAEWGDPSTEARLGKLITALFYLQQKYKNKESHEKAVGEWREDMDWLKETYYAPKGYSFKWPEY